MDITLENRKLSGTVNVIQSKSYAHRILLGASLAELTGGGKTGILLENDSEDIRATKRVIAGLQGPEGVMDCGESGTTLRFMVPVCAALGLAIYSMFIAIIVPPAKADKGVLWAVLIASAMSCAFYYIPLFEQLSQGFSIIICAVVASAIMAYIAPKSEVD